MLTKGEWIKMDDEQIIIKADKKHRIKILLVALILIIVGFFLLQYFQILLNKLSTLAEESPELAIQKAENTFKIIFSIMFLLSLGLCIYLFKLGTLIVKSGQFPPPGLKVIRDVKLETGQKAKSKGRIVQVLSVIFLMMGIIIPIMIFLTLRNM